MSSFDSYLFDRREIIVRGQSYSWLVSSSFI